MFSLRNFLNIALLCLSLPSIAVADQQVIGMANCYEFSEPGITCIDLIRPLEASCEEPIIGDVSRVFGACCLEDAEPMTSNPNAVCTLLSSDQTVEAEAPTVEAEAPTVEAEAPTVEAEAPTVEAEAPTVGAEAPTVGSSAPTVEALAVTAIGAVATIAATVYGI